MFSKNRVPQQLVDQATCNHIIVYMKTELLCDKYAFCGIFLVLKSIAHLDWIPFTVGLGTTLFRKKIESTMKN